MQEMRSAVNDVCQMLSDVIRSLADKPEDVRIELVQSEEDTVIRVQASQRNLGKIIGKDGRTARALRTILAANAAKLKRNITLDISKNDSA